MKNTIFLITVILISGLITSCEDKGAEPANPEIFKFDSLVAESYEIYYSVNPSTKITAYAKGSGLKYHWSATAGEIFGSGNQITYASNPGCCGGYQTIQCIVTDNSNQYDVKEVKVYVDF